MVKPHRRAKLDIMNIIACVKVDEREVTHCMNLPTLFLQKVQDRIGHYRDETPNLLPIAGETPPIHFT